jgi:transcriptional regulator with XRE-family HTH domain
MSSYRSAAGLSQETAGKVIGKRQSRMAELEAGQSNISLGDLHLLLNAYHVVDDQRREILMELRQNNHQRGRWTGLTCEVPPGLLQCPSFVHDLYSGHPYAENLIEARLARQTILRRDTEPARVAFIMSESSLRRCYATPEVMREQIDHMIKLSRLSNIQLQVLPFKDDAKACVEVAHRLARVGLRDSKIPFGSPADGVLLVSPDAFAGFLAAITTHRIAD